MAHRELELTLLSARHLKNVNMFMQMNVYAVASISGDPMTRQRTPTDTLGGSNPSWDATLRFSVPPSAKAPGSGGWLHVLLRSERALGDRDVGEVIVPLAELLHAGGSEAGTGPQGPRVVWYQVHKVQSGEPRGVLNVSYRLGPVVAPVRDDDKPPVIGLPAPQQPSDPQNPAPPQQPFIPQNPAPPQPHDSYVVPQPFKTPNPPVASRPFHHPEDAYASPQPFKHQNRVPPPTQQFINPALPHLYPYGTEAPLSPPLLPANGKRNGHGPTQVTQIIFGGVPTPPSNPNPAKTDHSWSKAFPQHQDTPTLPNTNPKKSDLSTRPQYDTKLGELSHTRSKIGQGKTTDHSARPQALKEQDNTKVSNTRDGRNAQVAYTPSSTHPAKADSTRPKEAYTKSGSNSTTGGKAENRKSGTKVVLQIERIPSMP